MTITTMMKTLTMPRAELFVVGSPVHPAQTPEDTDSTRHDTTLRQAVQVRRVAVNERGRYKPSVCAPTNKGDNEQSWNSDYFVAEWRDDVHGYSPQLLYPS